MSAAQGGHVVRSACDRWQYMSPPAESIARDVGIINVENRDVGCQLDRILSRRPMTVAVVEGKIAIEHARENLQQEIAICLPARISTFMVYIDFFVRIANFISHKDRERNHTGRAHPL